MDVIALVDGEHYPDVTRWGLRAASDAGYRCVAAILVGGMEKLEADGRLDLGGLPVITAGADARATLAAVIADRRPEAVLDLSDEPVLAYDRRMEMAAVALAAGVPYLGSDFRLDPPITESALPVSTVAVIGTGKRTGKTAVAGHVARGAAAAGGRPVIVAMGRGGPPDPVVAGPEDATLDALLARAERHEHAASDYLEDALTTGVPTVGARRCGGGMGGRPFVTNVADAAAIAVDMGADPVILEGSGAAVPTVPWDAGVLVIPANLPPHYLGGYLGPLRVLLSDLAVFIIGSGSATGADNLSTLDPQVRRLHAGIRVAHVALQPVPLADVRDKDVFFATTAQPEAAVRLQGHLERTAGCRVVSVSSNLADRAALERDLTASPPFEVLLTELKAAAVDVAARWARARGVDVVFVDNRPVTAGGDGEVDTLIAGVLGLARDRAAARATVEA